MDSIVFLGTASAQPSTTRSHSSLALRLTTGATWLFDVGEGSQHQLIRAPSASRPRMSTISRVFITHLHGDHCFGLPGLLCTVSAVASLRDSVISVYGPAGLRRYLSVALSVTFSRLGCRFEVHELHGDDDVEVSVRPVGLLHPDELPGTDIRIGDLEGGRRWTVCVSEKERMTVTAAPIVHTIPTVGYVITEHPSVGRLKVELVTPILMRNRDALGLKNPLVLLSKLKAGETLSMPDGLTLSPSEFVEPDRPGRCVVILGDTSDPSKIIKLISPHGCDLLIHEATNACLAEDISTGATESEIEQKTISHGHSTPQMAGAFGRRVNARSLILNHFSSRYSGADDEESVDVMERIRLLAVSTFGSDEVVAVRDFSVVSVPQRRA